MKEKNHQKMSNLLIAIFVIVIINLVITLVLVGMFYSHQRQTGLGMFGMMNMMGGMQDGKMMMDDEQMHAMMEKMMGVEISDEQEEEMHEMMEKMMSQGMMNKGMMGMMK